MPDTNLGMICMKRFFTILVCSLFFCVGELSAQLHGQFYTNDDGHIYFQATNVSGCYFNAAIRAISNNRDNSETITVGQGFLLGPTTPWKWYWKKGDRIYVTYPNGQSVCWECPSTDIAYRESNVSFKGKHCNGTVGCDCPGFSPIQHKEVWKQAYCKHCSHHRSSHK